MITLRRMNSVKKVSQTIILRDIQPDDWVLGIRAAKWLLKYPKKNDAILAYGEGAVGNLKHFYVKRNKASITVRLC